MASRDREETRGDAGAMQDSAADQGLETQAELATLNWANAHTRRRRALSGVGSAPSSLLKI